MSLEGRHAVVTGGSRGIGEAIAIALAAAGAHVSLIGRNREKLEQVAEALRIAHAGRKFAAIVADVADSAAARRGVEAARQQGGPIDVLINNAGQAASAPFLQTDEALWQRMLSVNLNSAYFCTQAALPDMLGAGFGRVVNVASIAGLRGAPYISAYVASKHAMVGLTRALATEVSAKGITVNAVCPGYTDTDIVRTAVRSIAEKTKRPPEEARAALAAMNSLGRLIRPEEVAHTVAWLCGPEATGITGQAIELT